MRHLMLLATLSLCACANRPLAPPEVVAVEVSAPDAGVLRLPVLTAREERFRKLVAEHAARVKNAMRRDLPRLRRLSRPLRRALRRDLYDYLHARGREVLDTYLATQYRDDKAAALFAFDVQTHAQQVMDALDLVVDYDARTTVLSEVREYRRVIYRATAEILAEAPPAAELATADVAFLSELRGGSQYDALDFVAREIADGVAH